MSANERPATMAYDGRRRHLEEFLRLKQSGQFHRDLAVWADEQGLCTRTAKDYWYRAVWRELIEINGDTWKWCGEEYRPKIKRSAKTADAFERVEIRSKMETGPCRHNCTKAVDTDCRTCANFVNLKNKSFLQDEEAE